MQFDFGKNWVAFSRFALTPEKVVRATEEFRRLLTGIPLRDKSFLDIGFGQGLSLLCARQTGARVCGTDINPKCQEALALTASVMDCAVDFPVVIGSILDDTVVGRLRGLSPGGNGFDIVHSWGVLHHTGNMAKALQSAAALVADSGHLIVALYNRHYTSGLWLVIKWLYGRSPRPVKTLFAALLAPVIALAKFAVTGKNPFAQNRGMHFYYNVIDWVGGYPYEYADKDEVVALLAPQGFTCSAFVAAQVPTGCNEFVFRKTDTPAAKDKSRPSAAEERAPLPDNKTIYDINWDAWESMKRFGPMSRHTQRLMLKQCKGLDFSSILDIGCGPGIFLEKAAASFPGKRLAGIDISSAAVELARRRLPKGIFMEMDIAERAPQGSWDLVTMVDVAEHIEEDVRAFVNIKSICARYLLIVTLEGRMRDFEPEIGHVRNYGKGELKAKLERAGFSVVSYRHWGWPLYSPLYRDLSKGIDAHKTAMTAMRRFMATIAYMLLYCTWPGRGDLVVVLASPEKEGFKDA